MLNPWWGGLSLVALVGGIAVIVAPTWLVKLNAQLNKTLVSLDEVVVKYRYLVGALLLIVSYLCFRLARLT